MEGTTWVEATTCCHALCRHLTNSTCIHPCIRLRLHHAYAYMNASVYASATVHAYTHIP